MTLTDTELEKLPQGDEPEKTGTVIPEGEGGADAEDTPPEKEIEGEGAETGAGEDEEESLYVLPYRIEDRDANFEYRLVQREDGKWDLDDDTKERVVKVLPFRAFQSKYDRVNAEREKLVKQVEESNLTLSQKKQALDQIEQTYGPYRTHLEILKDPAVRKDFEARYTKQLKEKGYQGFDPHSGREESITHRENKITWETDTFPKILNMQRAILRQQVPGISDGEVDQILGTLYDNAVDYCPEIISRPELGYPELNLPDAREADNLIEKLKRAPMLVRKVLMADGKIKSPDLRELEKKNQTLEEDLDRARSRVLAKTPGAGGKGGHPSGGVKPKSKLPIDPMDAANAWLKTHGGDKE